MRFQARNVICTLAAIVLTPFIWILLFTGSDLTEMDLMEKHLAELRDRLHYAESLNQEREHDVHNLRNQVKLLLGVHQHGNMTNNESAIIDYSRTQNGGDILLPQAAQELLLNMSMGNVDMSIPNMFHYLPHLIGKPEAIRPAVKYSQGRTGVSVVIGVPTIKRDRESYLTQTIQSLVDSLNEDEQLDCLIVVLICEKEDQDFIRNTADTIRQRFKLAMASGLLEVISPAFEYYPSMSDLKDTFGDSMERVRWRVKQNLDYTYLMMYARSRGTYYVQLEDDVITKPGYLTTMKNFAHNQKMDEWILLEFSHLGFIGKLFKSRDLPFIVEFFLMFYKDKPVDWLLDHLLFVKVCNPEKDNIFGRNSVGVERRNSVYWILCFEPKPVFLASRSSSSITEELRLRYKPSLFQHIGTYSSLRGKVQKLKDKDFGKGAMHKAHLNPNAEVSTTLKVYDQYSLDRAYMGETFFWGVLPQQGDTISFSFSPPITITKYLFRSGNPEHPGDRFFNTTIEVLPAGRRNKDDTPLDNSPPESITIRLGDNSGTFPVTQDGFVVLNRFDVDSGLAEGQVPSELGPIDVIRLYVQTNSKSWVILSEILIDDKEGTAPR